MTDWQPHEFAVCVGMDAFRICIGLGPKNFTIAEIVRWLMIATEKMANDPR